MPMPPIVSTPPLMEGDSLTTDEFLCWDEMPDVKRAELIDGIVCMPSPVSLVHADYESFLGGYEPLVPDAAGILRSVCFPGLGLDIKSLWDGDLQRMNSVLQQGLATAGHADFVAQLEARNNGAVDRD